LRDEIGHAVVTAKMNAMKEDQDFFAAICLVISGNGGSGELFRAQDRVIGRVRPGGSWFAGSSQRQELNTEGSGFPQKPSANLDFAGRTMERQLGNDLASGHFPFRPAIKESLFFSTDRIPANGKRPALSLQGFDQFPGRLESPGRPHRFAREINDVGILDQGREFRVRGRNYRRLDGGMARQWRLPLKVRATGKKEPQE
jgi:hypothetical protein